MSARVDTINRGCLTDAMLLLPPAMDSIRARAQVLKIGLQESRYATRFQMGGGPARSYWQFETGGIKGIFTHRLTKDLVKNVCKQLGVPHSILSIYSAMGHNDVLGAAMARINLWWHAQPLPQIADEQGSYRYYIDCWNPGKPKPDKWPALHREVVDYLVHIKAK
jgi:hypothetical protein